MIWWKKKSKKTRDIFGKIDSYTCLKCNHQIKVPKEYIDQFKPGGKEYHIDGQSHLVCPNCRELIEIK